MQLIANCQIRNRMIPQHHVDRLLEDCIQATGIGREQLCLCFTPVILQAGRQFDLILHLYLPAGMPDEQADRICAALHRVMAQHLLIRNEDIWVTATRTLH